MSAATNTSWYYGATLPPDREPTSDQIALMNEAWFQNNVVKLNTFGKVGMFGHKRSGNEACVWGTCQPEYYFYMKFEPTYDITATPSATFRMWFQIGGSTSDWHGVEYIVGSAGITTTVDLVPVSSTNNNFQSNLNFDDDSEFRGQLTLSPYTATIWRYIPRWEQDETDGSIDRIEKGRVLKCEYDDALNPSSTSTTFEITLESATSTVAQAAIVLGLATLLAF